MNAVFVGKSAGEFVIVVAAIVVVMLISWASLRLADRLFARLGESGIRVATRVMGLILAAPLTIVTYVLVKRLYVIEALHTATPIPGGKKV